MVSAIKVQAVHYLNAYTPIPILSLSEFFFDGANSCKM